jgi:hypothetical protein
MDQDKTGHLTPEEYSSILDIVGVSTSENICEDSLDTGILLTMLT